jgi:hypothetical protein
MIKINRTIIFLILFYFLGYTHFLGGPFWLARFFFVVTIIWTTFFMIFIWKLKIFSKKISVKSEERNETLKVDVKVIE